MTRPIVFVANPQKDGIVTVVPDSCYRCNGLGIKHAPNSKAPNYSYVDCPECNGKRTQWSISDILSDIESFNKENALECTCPKGRGPVFLPTPCAVHIEK